MKSIISYIFAIQYHDSDDRERNKEIINYILFEKHTITNTTREFGRLVLENLDGFKKEYLKSLQIKTYNLKDILNNNDLLEFTDTVLIDYMPLRSFEYGKLFMKKFTEEVINKNEFNFYYNKIQNVLKKEEHPLKKIGEQVTKANEYNFTLQENLLLALVLKEKLIATKCSLTEYSLVSVVARVKILDLVKRLEIYKKILDKSYALRWNLDNGKNRGRGGPRL
ncbi:hypothetical protein SY27_05230 [Flavobacterium sp. 316]|uniref:hypothetical protein n=1 Tax=Flavobacterium sp. 316 TaxID=1603293 RepID=UPI0005E3B124|nr:hypothetical protein [Flavobacterium sp. 316]KIX22071.1 hypothetical protein SY27_05230 [Flavobacterium sp. 316]